MKTLKELQKLSKSDLINLVLEQNVNILRMKELLNRKEEIKSSWSIEDAQRDGGGFTDSERLRDYENRW